MIKDLLMVVEMALTATLLEQTVELHGIKYSNTSLTSIGSNTFEQSIVYDARLLCATIRLLFNLEWAGVPQTLRSDALLCTETYMLLQF